MAKLEEFGHLEAEWHPTRNGKLTSNAITKYFNSKAWWLCSEGHEWQATPYRRTTRNDGCPKCSSKVSSSSIDNNLGESHPSIAAEWHPTKNYKLAPEKITSRFTSKVWWLCSEGHEWQATPYRRTTRNDGCRLCIDTSTIFVPNNLAQNFPYLIAEWHPTRNGRFLPHQVTEHFTSKVWWLCSEGHEWETLIRTRITGKVKECPTCSGRNVLVEFLMKINPLWASECHPTKNEKLYSFQFNIKAIWWICLEGHEWEATIASRLKRKDRSCTICSGEKNLAGITDLCTIKPLLSTEWHPTKNGKKKPQNVSINSKIKVWWICVKGHEWNTSPISLIRNQGSSGCPICTNEKRLVEEWHPTRNDGLKIDDIIMHSPIFNWWLCSKGHEWRCYFAKRITEGNILLDCPTCSNLVSFKSEWHPTKNDSQGIECVVDEPRKKNWWLCSKGHEWKESTHERTRRGSVSTCPFCTNHKKVIVGENDFQTTHPEVATEWHPTKNGKITPDYITVGVNYKYWWFNASCGHEWEAFISNRIRGAGCRVCSGRSEYKTGAFTGLKLFTANPKLAAEWHPTKNGKLTPRNVASGSSKKVWWLCSKGHEWEATITSRSRGNGCRQCWAATYVSKAEKEIYEYIKLKDKNIVVQASDRKILNGKELDIYVPDKKIAIEFNGVYWHSEAFGQKNQKYHYNKWIACRKKGIQLIQIWEDDWNRNPEQIKNIIDHALQLPELDSSQNVQTMVEIVNESQARKFLEMFHVEGFVAGSQYFGLVETQHRETIHALVVVDSDATNIGGKSLTIVRYAAKTNMIGYLDKFLTSLIDLYDFDSFLATSDNCGIDGEIYKALGFKEEKVFPPDYMYAVVNKRYPKSEYSLDRFREDGKLEFDEDFTAEDLAYLNDIHRIWDAGKTRYKLSL